MLNASRYTPVDATLIPTGEIASVEGTPLDFRTPTPIGQRIGTAHEQLLRGKGYDHNFVLDPSGVAARAGRARVRAEDRPDARGRAPRSPGVQFYSGNFLDGTLKGKGGAVYGSRAGFCLETQHYPDSPNQPAFPSTILSPGETLRSKTVLTFGVRR